MIIKLVASLISEETSNTQERPVSEMSDEELARAIRSAAPALAMLKGS